MYTVIATHSFRTEHLYDGKPGTDNKTIKKVLATIGITEAIKQVAKSS